MKPRERGFFFLPPGCTDYDPCGIRSRHSGPRAISQKNAIAMILSSLDPAPSGAHPRGRTWPVTLTITFAFLDAIWRGQPPTEPPPADFCSKHFLNYHLLVSEPLGASVSRAKNRLVESSFLGAIYPDQPSAGLSAADFLHHFCSELSNVRFQAVWCPHECRQEPLGSY